MREVRTDMWRRAELRISFFPRGSGGKLSKPGAESFGVAKENVLLTSCGTNALLDKPTTAIPTGGPGFRGAHNNGNGPGGDGDGGGGGNGTGGSGTKTMRGPRARSVLQVSPLPLALRLLPETKTNRTQHADQYVSFHSALGLSLGIWLLELRSLQERMFRRVASGPVF